ncbi:tyrosine-protein phosphatase [Geobacillus stearothermophilus]|uniref:tyrosine-protein phosphatase n=1 Tax=Geobacillus stearothermophilus TaxID=1422 RepID=UPI0006AC35B5|nr:CpsB/CapC family capsule biosynthesis tyrosine phosphatase [Geobacillus stearothermophilus]KOR94054.1 tyrosine protein phosphatase [Geobacillus stearothermophilus ATCC 12980]MED4356044.1 tyrosine protein phosphatase [Geobacillus stearothermophilus]MED4358873.1 tyrosine protein phosphatase [Geobacillus stearothermophilus]MED4879766.1 tyrosine protein phosphatase [Geobacillus stearothermophilus]MED5010323.1 tyrosine protein phosphatase [Geobacillus stearothermophilus]
MIDIHSHILPGVDDGAAAMENAIAMAQAAAKEGITTIIATPHHQNGTYENPRPAVLSLATELNDELKRRGITLNVLPGQEVRIHGDLLDGLARGEVMTLADTPYILIEFPSDHVPKYAEQLLFDAQVKGFTPIIAHPERNVEIIEYPERLYQLVKRGALTQLTASSVTGHFGKNIKTFSFQLIEANLAHFIASDVHNTKTRPFRLREAYETVRKEFGTEALHYFRENAEQLIRGQAVFRDEPQRVRKKKFLGLF